MSDVEAVRVLPMKLPGINGILSEAWARYKRPLAITEVHLGCTREEQMRWLLEVWNSATALRRQGVDIRAVTVWALLGSYDWNSLLTRREGYYEPGVFDLRGSEPRPTALAAMMRQLADGQEPQHPVLAVPGWWRRSKRLLYTAPESPLRLAGLAETTSSSEQAFVSARPLLIAGAEGALGYAFVRLCDHRGLAYRALSRQEMDITDPASIQAALARYEPWAVINAAGFTHVDRAEQEMERCFQENASGPALLATECARRSLPLLTFSFRSSLQWPSADTLSERGTAQHLRIRMARAKQKRKNLFRKSGLPRSSCAAAPSSAPGMNRIL